MSRQPVGTYLEIPPGLTESEVSDSWQKLEPEKRDFFSHMTSRQSEEIKNIFGKNCVLFFPPNRFEDPAWA